MDVVLSGHRAKLWARLWAAAWIVAFAWAQAAFAATPVPLPKPRLPAAAAQSSDPIGALLREQGLTAASANMPVVIGLKLSENGKNSRFTIEFSDPVDVRVFTLSGPDRVILDM